MTYYKRDPAVISGRYDPPKAHRQLFRKYRRDLLQISTGRLAGSFVSRSAFIASWNQSCSCALTILVHVAMIPKMSLLVGTELMIWLTSDPGCVF